MPRRSNIFQKLVLTLKKQLEIDATVTESAMLPDVHSGDLREVDIFIVKCFGDYTLRIGIECCKHKKRADVRWVEQMIAKHTDLPIDQSVLVSASGFTKGGTKKARLYGMETITLEAACDADWNDALRTTYAGRFIINPLTVYAHTSVPPHQVLAAISPAQFAFDPSGSPICPMRDLVTQALNPAVTACLQKATPETEGMGQFHLKLPEHIYLKDTQGELRAVGAFSGVFRWEAPSRIPVPLSRGRLEGVPVMFGAGTRGGTSVEFVQVGNGAAGAILVVKETGKPEQETTMDRAADQHLLADAKEKSSTD